MSRKAIRERTPEEQRIYTQVIDRLMAGERAIDLAEEYSVPAGTLRSWKAARRRRDKKALKGSSDVLSAYSESKAAQTLHPTENLLATERCDDVAIALRDVASAQNADPAALRERNDELGDGLKTLLLEQASVPRALLGALRGEVGRVLQNSHVGLAKSIEYLRNIIESGQIEVENGEIERLSLSQLKMAVGLLKDASKAFSELHLLPHGTFRTAPLKFSDAVPPQHLHLHSHGRKHTPRALEVDAAPKANPPPAAAKVLANDQLIMVEEL